MWTIRRRYSAARLVTSFGSWSSTVFCLPAAAALREGILGFFFWNVVPQSDDAGFFPPAQGFESLFIFLFSWISACLSPLLSVLLYVRPFFYSRITFPRQQPFFSLIGTPLRKSLYPPLPVFSFFNLLLPHCVFFSDHLLLFVVSFSPPHPKPPPSRVRLGPMLQLSPSLVSVQSLPFFFWGGGLGSKTGCLRQIDPTGGDASINASVLVGSGVWIPSETSRYGCFFPATPPF